MNEPVMVIQTAQHFSHVITIIELCMSEQSFSHTSGSHVKPTTASLTFIHTIKITASQIYTEVQEHELGKMKMNV